MNRTETELLQKYFDGSLSEEEAEELLLLLETDSTFSETAYQQFALHHEIRFLGLRQSRPYFSLTQEASAVDGILDEEERRLLAKIMESYPLPDLSECSPPSVAKPVRTTKKRVKPYEPIPFDLFSKVVFSVFFIMLGLGVILWLQSPDRQNMSHHTWKYRPLATVGAVVDPVFFGVENTIKSGQTLGADEVRLESGTIELTMNNGTHLILEGPLDFRLLSSTKTFCRRGKISATVPPSGKGFEISSPNFSVIDLGTEFLFETTPEQSEVHTIKGKVEISDLESRKMPVLQGKAFQFRHDKEECHEIDADPLRFTLKSSVWEAFVRRLSEREAIRSTQSEKFTSLPGTLLFFDFTKKAPIVSNRVPNAEQYSGTPYGLRFGPGQSPDGGAAGFFGDTSRVELSVPQTLRSMTLVAVVKPGSLDQFVHCLLVSRSVEPGSLVWQIAGDGNLQFGIRAGREGRETRFVSAPCFHPRNCGAWYTIATVVDAAASEIRHYRDGIEIGREKLEHLPEIRPGDLTLGNGFWNSKTLSRRQFGGWFDEFYLFDRALSEQEIVEIN